MRIGLVIYGSLDTISGGFLYDRKLVEYLRSQGDQVEIVSLPWRSYSRHLADNLSRNLYRRLNDLQVDVLMEDELNHPSLITANLRLRRKSSRFPIIAIVHHLRCSEQRPGWQNSIYGLIERRYLATIDAFIINSRHTSQSVSKLLHPRGSMGAAFDDSMTAPVVVAVPAGDRFAPQLDPNELAARQRQPGPLRLLFLGNLIARKGLHIVLDALAGLPAGSWELSVAGSQEADPAYSRRVKGLSARLGINDRVKFLGALVDDRLAAVLRSSQLLVLPSSHEGYGIAYLEGMSFGLPAIGGSRGAAAEIITPGVNGWLIDPDDPAGLRSAIARLADDRELLLKFSLAARQRYQEHPTWQQTDKKIRDFIIMVANEN